MCGLYGFLRYGEKINDLADLTNALAEESATRGVDATGIAFCGTSGVNVLKESKSAYRIKFKHPDEIRSMIGHTRHATHGSEKLNHNNHPFYGKCKNSAFALAHNGVLSNDDELRSKYNLPKTKIKTDSYVAVQLLESQKLFGFDSIKYMSEKTEGSFSYSMLDDKNNVWLVKGDSPLSILHFPKMKIYVYASTDEILFKSIIGFPPLFSSLKNGDIEAIDIFEGEILKIRPDGYIERGNFNFSHSYGKDWWDYGSYSSFAMGSAINDDELSAYIDDLKSVAIYQGFRPGEVDELLEAGFSIDEVEEYIYCNYGGEI